MSLESIAKPMNVTVLGGRGFVGRHLVAHLRELGHTCWVPERDDPQIFTRHLGLVFYCIGLTANFRTHPFETVDAHVGVLRGVLARAQFDRLIYLSSTRVYDGCETTNEDQSLRVRPGSADHLYNLSKLMGEGLALSCGRSCQVVRLSNVVGPDMGGANFLGSVLQDAREAGAVAFKTAMQSSKDYLWIDDAVQGLMAIAFQGKHMIYNLASGNNLSHGELAAWLQRHDVRVTSSSNAPLTCFPSISVRRLHSELGFAPLCVQDRMLERLKPLLGRSTPPMKVM